MIFTLQAKLLAGVVLVGALVGTHWMAYQAGDTHGVNALLVDQQQETMAKLSERVAANSALADRFRLDAEKAGASYEKELAAVRATATRHAGQRVPIDPKQFCGVTGSTEATQTGSLEPSNSGTSFLPETFTIDLQQLATQADEVTAAYRTLRERSAACFQ